MTLGMQEPGLGASRGGGGGWMAGETMLSALAEESSPPSSCSQPRSPSDPPFEAITLSPGQAHQRISGHLRGTFTAPSTGAGPQPRLRDYAENIVLNTIVHNENTIKIHFRSFRFSQTQLGLPNITFSHYSLSHFHVCLQVFSCEAFIDE